MKFIVYEDESFFYELIKKEIEALSIEMDIEFDVLYAKSIEDVFRFNEDGLNINILDIVHDNGNEDGITVAQKLRDKYRDAHIVFYTSRMDKTYEVINTYVEPLSYIFKGDPNVRVILKNAIQRVISDTSEHKGDRVLKLKDIDGDQVFLKYSDIYYINTDEKRQKYVNVYLFEGTIKVKGLLKDFIGINDDFVQVSKSSIVNKSKIKLIKKTHSSRVKKIITNRPEDETDGKCLLTDKFKNNLI